MNPTPEEVIKKLTFVAEESRLALLNFEVGKMEDAFVQLINLRAAATVAKQDVETLIRKGKVS